MCAAGLRPAAGIRPPSVPKPPLGLPDQPRRAPRSAAAPANAAIPRRHFMLKTALFRRALGASGGRRLALPACSGSAAGPAGRKETIWVHPARGELVGAVRRRQPGATGRAAAARQAGSVPVSSVCGRHERAQAGAAGRQAAASVQLAALGGERLPGSTRLRTARGRCAAAATGRAGREAAARRAPRLQWLAVRRRWPTRSRSRRTTRCGLARRWASGCRHRRPV